MQEALLSVDGINKKFGGLVAIQDLSFEVAPGEVVGFLGPNGAGKTTLINIIAGDMVPDTGTVTYKEIDITRVALHKKCRIGVGRTYQIPQPFINLSVQQNVAVAAMYGVGLGQQAANQKALQILEFTGLADKRQFLAMDLDEISLKRLELARSLASEPKLLLIDELAGGLTEKEIPQVLNLLRDINEMGITLILIEHVMKVMMKAVGRIIVMEEGRIIASGLPESVIEDEKVITAYFG